MNLEGLIPEDGRIHHVCISYRSGVVEAAWVDEALVDGLETFTRLAYERHEQAIAFATAIQASA